MWGSILTNHADQEWQIGKANVRRKSLIVKGNSEVNPALSASTSLVIWRLFRIPESPIKVEMSTFNLINQYL